MNVAIEVLVVIVRNPTAQEAAGATIANPPDVWIPPRIVRSRPNRRLVEMWESRARCEISKPRGKSVSDFHGGAISTAIRHRVLIEEEMKGTKSYPT